MIEDTCSCSAIFKIKLSNDLMHYSLNEVTQHSNWLDSHKICREKAVRVINYLPRNNKRRR